VRIYFKRLTQLIGVVGTIVSIVLFVREPSFPTPDKLLVFITLVFMAVNQGWAVFRRLAPFVLLLLTYESFRGLVPKLNTYVNYGFMPAADRLMFGGQLPTAVLQHWLWHGHMQWYDFVFYLAYMMHFVFPVVLALVVWKYRAKEYWRYVTTFVVVSFAGFLTFLAFPAAPPWMASDLGIIPHIQRISSMIFFALGLKDFPSVYNKLSPNPVAAVPSLHAAYATLFALFITLLFRPSKPKSVSNKAAAPRRRLSWYSLRWLAWLHPALIWVGTVYQGEHYAIDEIIGIAYAIGAYFAAPYVLRALVRFSQKGTKWGSTAWQRAAHLLQ